MGDELASYQFIRPNWLARGLAGCSTPSCRASAIAACRTAKICAASLTTWAQGQDGTGHQFRHRRGQDGAGGWPGCPHAPGIGRRPVVLYTGVLDQFQRIDLLLEAMKEVVWYEPRAKLLIVVTIPHAGHQARIQQQAQELGIARNVIMTDPQTLSSLPDFLAAGDVAVVPRPAAAGFPIKLLNYMAAQGRACCSRAPARQDSSTAKTCCWLLPTPARRWAKAFWNCSGTPSSGVGWAGMGSATCGLHHDRLVVAQRICDAYVRTMRSAGAKLKIARRLKNPRRFAMSAPPSARVFMIGWDGADL